RFVPFALAVFLTSTALSCARADDAEDALKKASAALKKGDNEAGLKAADEAVKLDPKNATAWYLRGEAKARFRKHEEASKDFEKARKALLAIGKDRRVPMMKIYDLIQGKAKPEEVIETAEKAKLDGEDKNEALFYANLYVGLNYEAEGNSKKALEHLTTAVE